MKVSTWLIAAVVIIIVIILVCFVAAEKPIYKSMEDFCQHFSSVEGIIGKVEGEDSCFVVTQEKDKGRIRISQVFFKKVEGGYMSVGNHSISLGITNNYLPKLLYIRDRNSNDHYVSLWIFSSETKIIDSENSEFCILPVGPITEAASEPGYLAIAYVGQKSHEYYKTEYWIQVNSADD